MIVDIAGSVLANGVALTRAARSHDTTGAWEHGARESGPRASGAAPG